MKAMSGKANPKHVDCGDGSDEKSSEEEDDEELMPNVAAIEDEEEEEGKGRDEEAEDKITFSFVGPTWNEAVIDDDAPPGDEAVSASSFSVSGGVLAI